MTCQHIWNKNGKTPAGLQRSRCRICGATQQEPSEVGQGRPRIYENSTDRFKRENRKMTHTYKFERLHSYSSHPRLSKEEQSAIDKSCYDNFPRFAIVDSKKIGLIDHDWHRTPDQFTQSGYVVFKEKDFTIRIKRHILSESPNYRNLNGCGDCHSEIIIRCDRPCTFEK